MSASPSIVVIKVVRISRLASSRKCEVESIEREAHEGSDDGSARARSSAGFGAPALSPSLHERERESGRCGGMMTHAAAAAPSHAIRDHTYRTSAQKYEAFESSKLDNAAATHVTQEGKTPNVADVIYGWSPRVR